MEDQSPPAKQAKLDLPALVYPWKTTHFRHWTNLTAGQVRQTSLAAHDEALKGVMALQEANPGSKPVQILSTEELESNKRYLLWHLFEQLESAPGMTYRVKATAMAYFARILWKSSVLNPSLDVRKAMYTCWMLACKAEEQGMRVTAGQILSKDVEKFVSRDEMARLEVPVLELLDFHLHVVHPRSSIQFLLDHFHFYAKAKKTNYRPYQELQQHLRVLLLRTSALYISDIPFIYNPAEIALASLRVFPPNGYDLSDLDSFIRTQAWGGEIDRDRIEALGRDLVQFFSQYSNPSVEAADSFKKYVFMKRDEGVLAANKALGKYYSRINKLQKGTKGKEREKDSPETPAG